MAVEWSEGAWEGRSKRYLEKAEKDVTRMKLGGCSCHAADDGDGCAGSSAGGCAGTTPSPPPSAPASASAFSVALPLAAPSLPRRAAPPRAAAPVLGGLWPGPALCTRLKGSAEPTCKGEGRFLGSASERFCNVHPYERREGAGESGGV